MFSLKKKIGYVFLYTCAYRTFAKILSNINVYSNITGFIKPIHPRTLGDVNDISSLPLASRYY